LPEGVTGPSGICYQGFNANCIPSRSAVGSTLEEYQATVQGEAGTAQLEGVGATTIFEHRFYPSPCSPVPPTPTVSLSPPDAVNEVGTTHTVTATVADQNGTAVVGTTVLFSTAGSSTVNGKCTTGADGRCSFTYSGPRLPGADLITACADVDGDGSADAGEPCGTATKAWVLPTSTPGQVTGGGQVSNALGNDQVAFGFTAKSTSTGIKGECNLVDPSTDTHIKCQTVASIVRAGNRATIFGHATVNGVTTDYRIDTTDNGEPGAGRDLFEITTGTGYTAGGPLARGNVQVR
jgi:hypothetical protein